MLGDKYYGKTATNYDAERCHSLRWAREQLAVSDWVFSGPVLDVPVGTGRYIGIYREKGLKVTGFDISHDMLAVARKNYPCTDLRQGSIFALPFRDEEFATVVCTRLLDWLSPSEMPQAVCELRRVAKIAIVTIRHGQSSCRVNYTHPLESFYQAIDGLYIEDRRTTEITQDGTEEIFRLRPPTWDDVVQQFNVPDAIFCNPADEIQRLADEWVGRLWPFSIQVNSASVSAHYWSASRLWSVLDAMAAIHDESVKDPCNRYVTSLEPRRKDGPLTVLHVNGTEALLDGRRRINQISRDDTGLYPVLLLTVQSASLGTGDRPRGKAGATASTDAIP